MKKITKTILVFLLTLPLCSFASFPFFHSTTLIDPLIKLRLPNANIGIIVADANTGKIVYEKNSQNYFTPASNAKIFTAAAALYGLGPQFTFQTTAGISAKRIQNHVLHGNLYIRFGGDPSLTTKDLQDLLLQVKQYGIHKINGNIIIDNSFYERPYYGFGWSHDDLDYAFAAPSESIILDEDIINIQLNGNKPFGFRPVVTQRNNRQFFPIDNQLMIVGGQQAKEDCEANFNVDQNNRISLEGCWAKGGMGMEQLAVRNPFLYAKNIVKKQIPCSGKIIQGNMPSKAVIIATHASKPLSVLLTRMMKKSDNVYANSFLKMLGKKYYSHGTFKLGSKAEKKILLDKAGINPKQISIFDGSGQSRYPLATPFQFYQLLYALYHDSNIRSTFMHTLPITGVDGTLKYWKKPEIIAGKVRAKTGTMMGVSSLSGYVKTHSGNDLIFSILINNVQGKLNSAHLLQREILKSLVES